MIKFTLIVPTLNPGDLWAKWVEALQVQRVMPDKVLIVDSGSEDSTLDICNSYGFDVISIRKSEFNHGGTRQMALQSAKNVDIVIYMTQDAILTNENSISNILQPFENTSIAAVCGRQLPHITSGPIETHARLFSYADKSFVSTIEDRHYKGLKTAFLSDSFAAYRVSALTEIGGFPENVIFGEDMYVAAKLLQANYKIFYAANACVYHAHNYSFIQELRRYFDMGVFHAHEPWIRRDFGTAESEGLKFLISELKYLLGHSFWRVPESVLRTIIKYIGFRLGLAEGYISLNIKRKLSMNPGYFKIE